MGLDIIKLPNSILAESGLNASALVTAPSFHGVSTITASGRIEATSGLFVSGLDSSALVKGTIGEFLASVNVGSGINSSGVVGGSSGVFVSGIDCSALIKTVSLQITSATVISGSETVTSLIVLSGASILGNLNVSGIITTSNNAFIGGLISTIYLRTNSSVEVGTNLEVSGKLSVGASAFILSGLEVGETIKGSSNVLIGGRVSAVNIYANGSGSFGSGLNTGGYTSINGGFTVNGVTSFADTVKLQNIPSGSTGYLALLPTGYNNDVILISGVVGGTSSLFIVNQSGQVWIASALLVRGTVSVNASATFQSGLNTSGLIDATALKLNIASLGALQFNTSGEIGMQWMSGVIEKGWIVDTNTGLVFRDFLEGTYEFRKSDNNGAVSIIQGHIRTTASITAGGNISVNGSGIFGSGGNFNGKISVNSSGIFESGISVQAHIEATSGIFASGLFPISGATASTGNANIGGATASLKWGTIFAASTTIGDLAFTDERCEICESTFDIGEQVTVLLKGGLSGMDADGNKWRYVGGPPVHMNHLVASMIRSAM